MRFCKLVDLIIYGTGACAQKLIKFLTKDYIKYFVETSPKNKEFYGCPVISLEELKTKNYTHLIIASSYKEEIIQALEQENILDERVIVFKDSYIEYYYSEKELNMKLERIKKEKIDILALGLSYTRDGITSSLYKNKVINLSYSSQDLYMDYEIIKYLSNNESLGNVKNVILGLGYYSFHHDMSKTKYKDVISRYLMFSHHKRIQVLDKDYLLFRDTIPSMFNNYNDDEIEQIVSNKYFHENITDDRIEEGIELAYKHSKMNRPDTRKENLFYFNEILKICLENYIKVCLVIFPTDKNYYEYITEECKERFYFDLNQTSLKFDLKIIDLMQSEDFDGTDFWDTSHLNFSGSRKMVEIINKHVE